MLTRTSFTGIWASLPVAWTDADTFDEDTYRGDVGRCCATGVHGVYTGGTTGEFYAMELTEFQAIARATVEEAHACGKPAMVGCSSTYTLGAARRAEYAAAIGADAIHLVLPFWLEVPDEQVVPFFQAVTAASGGLPLSIYDTQRARKLLTVDQHRAIKDAVPSYLMVKATEGSVGLSPAGCRALSEFINVFCDETDWRDLAAHGVRGACSWLCYWNPRLSLRLWQLLQEQRWDALRAAVAPAKRLIDFVVAEFEPRGLTDTALDRFGAGVAGILQCGLRSRAPYPQATPHDVQLLIRWYRSNFPEMLQP